MDSRQGMTTEDLGARNVISNAHRLAGLMKGPLPVRVLYAPSFGSHVDTKAVEVGLPSPQQMYHRMTDVRKKTQWCGKHAEELKKKKPEWREKCAGRGQVRYQVLGR